MPHPSQSARAAAHDFLKVAADFSLGELVTESAHPRSINLSDIARASAARGLATLFDVDRDVVSRFDEWSRLASRPAWRRPPPRRSVPATACS